MQQNASGGSLSRWSSSVSDYAEVSALNYRVYFSEGIQDDFEATINVNFSDLNVYGVGDNHIGNYYANGSSGAGYYTQENEVVTVDPNSYLGDDASYYRYGPDGGGVYSGGSIGYQDVGRELYIGMSDLRANYTSVDNGVHGSGYYENVAPQVLGDHAEAFDSDRVPQFFNNGEYGSGWYLYSGRSGSVGSGSYRSWEEIQSLDAYYGGSYSPYGSGYYEGSTDNSYGSRVGDGSFYGRGYSYGSQGSGVYYYEHGSVDGSLADNSYDWKVRVTISVITSTPLIQAGQLTLLEWKVLMDMGITLMLRV